MKLIELLEPSYSWQIDFVEADNERVRKHTEQSYLESESNSLYSITYRYESSKEKKGSEMFLR